MTQAQWEEMLESIHPRRTAGPEVGVLGTEDDGRFGGRLLEVVADRPEREELLRPPERDEPAHPPERDELAHPPEPYELAHPPERDESPHPPERASPRPGEVPRPAAARVGLTLREIWAALSRRRIGMAVWVIVVCGSATFFTLSLPKTYQSDVLVLVEGDEPGPDARALEALGWFGGTGKIETEMGLILSRSVLGPVTETLGLHVLVWAGAAEGTPSELGLEIEATPRAGVGSFRAQRQGGLWYVSDPESGAILARAAAGDPLTFAGLSLVAPRDTSLSDFDFEVAPLAEAMDAARERISVSRVAREGDLVRVRCDGSSPSSAQALCHEVSTGYIRLKTSLQRTEASATSRFLADQSALLRDRLRAAEDSLESYGRRNDAVALGERAAEEIRQLTGLVAQREQIEAERAALTDLITQIESRTDGPARYRDLASFPTFLQVEAVSQLLATLVQLDSRRSELALLRSDSNTDLMALDRRIVEVEAQVHRFAVSYEAGLRAQLSSLDASLLNADSRIARIPTRLVETARLEREATLLGDLYNLLETSRREAELAEAVELPDVRILDEASVPIRHASPSLPRNGLLGLLLGTALGMTWALMREMTDANVYDLGHLERVTGLPVLGAVPTVDQPRPLFGERPVGRIGHKTQLRGAVARESFRGLVSDLRFLRDSAGGTGLRRVVVTSAGPGEGKTFTACNLAQAHAAAGVRTALVDADLRTGDATRLMGFEGAAGLHEVLAGRKALEDVLRRVPPAREGHGRPLTLVPAGRLDSEAATLLYQRNFLDVIQTLSTKYECMIVDTPPVSLFSDAITIGAWADGVIVVVRREVTDRGVLSQTLERLSRTGANIVGVVLNDASLPERYGDFQTYYSIASRSSAADE